MVDFSRKYKYFLLFDLAALFNGGDAFFQCLGVGLYSMGPILHHCMEFLINHKEPAVSLARVYDSLRYFENVGSYAASFGRQWSLYFLVGQLVAFTRDTSRYMFQRSSEVYISSFSDAAYKHGSTPSRECLSSRVLTTTVCSKLRVVGRIFCGTTSSEHQLLLAV